MANPTKAPPGMGISVPKRMSVEPHWSEKFMDEDEPSVKPSLVLVHTDGGVSRYRAK